MAGDVPKLPWFIAPSAPELGYFDRSDERIRWLQNKVSVLQAVVAAYEVHFPKVRFCPSRVNGSVCGQPFVKKDGRGNRSVYCSDRCRYREAQRARRARLRAPG